MRRRDLNHDLRLLTRAARAQLITLEEAGRALGLSPRATTLRLSTLAARGWVRRIKRGVFLVVPLKSPEPREETPRDPEILAEALFAPCYIAGWSAAARWRLDHVTRVAILVATASRVRRTSVRVEGHRFHLVRVPAAHVRGPDIAAHRLDGARISGPERTIVDALCDPRWLGGAIYLADALRLYRGSARWDEDRLTDVLREVGTGAAHKRLGALLDAKQIPSFDLVRQAAAGRTRGVVDLDPGSPRRGRIDSKWGVRLNACLEGWELPEDESIPVDFLEGVDDPDP